MKRLSAILALMRPAHWIKNVFVLAGIFFAGEIFHPESLRSAGLAFLAFCLASSAVYALNDVLDRKSDGRHPRKRLRPVASGSLAPSAATALSLAFAGAGLLLAARVSKPLFAVILIYLLINVAYSRWLKHMVLVDVFCIASGFILRLLAGTWGIDIPPSPWFMLCTFLLSLFLGFSKRYAERMDPSQDPSEKRAVVEEYSPEFLRILLAVTLACTIMAYGLYTMSPSTLQVHGTGKLVYTLPLAAFVMFRYLWLVMRRGYGENLASELPRDKLLTASVVFYAVCTFLIL